MHTTLPINSPLISRILTSAMARLSFTTNLETITSVVADTARALTGADGTSFVLRDGDMCFYADENAISPLWKGKRFPVMACISGWSMNHRQIVVIPDIYTDERIPHDAYRPTFVKSLCMVPIGEHPVGAIGTYWANGKVPSPEDIRMLEILANSTAVALENLELKREIVKGHMIGEKFRIRTKELELALHAMAHDLRTPISAMTDMAELMLQKVQDGPLGQYAQAVLATGKQVEVQIDRMLGLHRAAEGKLEKVEFNFSEFAENIIQHFYPQVKNREVKFIVDPDMIAFADPDLLRIVLESLISNAVKFSAAKSKAEIQVGQTQNDGRTNVFYVKDNGGGFDHGLLQHLFKPLQRQPGAYDFGTTGLGLASVAKIIELHGGNVRAEGEKDVGATFFFSLPALV